jgi:hypothetical protein
MLTWDAYLDKSGVSNTLQQTIPDEIKQDSLEDFLLDNNSLADFSITNAKIKSVSADKITTSTLTAQVNVGTSSGTEYVMLDGANNRIIVHDGDKPRIVIGNV